MKVIWRKILTQTRQEINFMTSYFPSLSSIGKIFRNFQWQNFSSRFHKSMIKYENNVENCETNPQIYPLYSVSSIFCTFRRKVKTKKFLTKNTSHVAYLFTWNFFRHFPFLLTLSQVSIRNLTKPHIEIIWKGMESGTRREKKEGKKRQSNLESYFLLSSYMLRASVCHFTTRSLRYNFSLYSNITYANVQYHCTIEIYT